jgi:MFS family permease
MTVGRVTVVAALGTTQTIAWASSYYMPAILGAPIAGALHLPTSVFFGLFSGALLLSAVVGPSVGRLIDRHGGRHLLAASNLVIGAGLLILAAAHSIAGLVVAWTVLGIGIGMGLYDPAFATLTWLYGRDARSAITGITLIAGFASTIGWPLTAVFLDIFGWRIACLIWAGLNMLLAAPINWLAIPRHGVPTALPRATTETVAAAPPRAAMPILAFFFSATWFVQGAMAAHLPALLQATGASSAAAIAAASLVGPAQVGARIVEFGLLRSFHPVSSARLASALHPIGAAFLVMFGAPGIIAFALLHGAGNGMITIAKGTLPLALFGPGGYGPAQRFAVGTGPDATSGSAVSVWLAARPGRARRGRIISWAVPRCFRLVIPAAPTPRRRGALRAGPRLRRKLLDDSIVQGGLCPPTIGR